MGEKNNVSDSEMLKTFNCGIGFCLIVQKKNIKKNSKFFHKKYKPMRSASSQKKRKKN